MEYAVRCATAEHCRIDTNVAHRCTVSQHVGQTVYLPIDEDLAHTIQDQVELVAHVTLREDNIARSRALELQQGGEQRELVGLHETGRSSTTHY